MQSVTKPTKVVASAVISELQSSDMYLTLVARLFDLRANLNGVRVTEAFLDEIVENETKYICHPLYADIRGLLANKTVGHMYNKRTGEFHSTQIGAFYHFEKEQDGDNTYLLGYARVPKRNKALCKVLSNLFTDNALKFSFEVNCGAYTREDDGTMLIDADQRNYWEGECVVTFPACETAIAKQLVAECLNKGDENMADENIVNVETAENEQMNEEVVQAEAESEVVETAEVEVAETEIAETVVITHEHVEHDTVRAHNCDTGEDAVQHVTVETIVRTPVQLAEDAETEEDLENDNNDVVAETEAVAECNTDENDADDEDDNKECAEATTDWATVIAELQEAINVLRNEVAELRNIPATAAAVIAETVLSEENESEQVVAEEVTGSIDDEPLMNPFMASISAPKKYSLLDSEEKSARKYSLLDRA